MTILESAQLSASTILRYCEGQRSLAALLGGLWSEKFENPWRSEDSFPAFGLISDCLFPWKEEGE